MPKPVGRIENFTDPAFIPSIVQFEVTHLTISEPHLFFSFCQGKLQSSIQGLFFKYENKIEPGLSWLTPLMQPEIKGAHSLHEN